MPQEDNITDNGRARATTGVLPEILLGKRLTLRPLKLSDAKRLARFGGDYDIARMTGSFPRHFPQLSAEFRIMYMAAQTHRALSFNYAVTETGQDELIGVVDLFRAHRDDMLEIGYWIAKPFWNTGYATDAAKMILTTAQKHLGLTRVKAGVFADNPASLRVLEKLGFIRHGKIGTYFSMARLENTPSINMTLDLNNAAFNEVGSSEIVQETLQASGPDLAAASPV